ncbi:MAG: DUF1538 domain-containing protein [Lachnospiraceae bacterium]|nr:DUF1538 domain-containing protein [Lachnospiraceae bacterium]
MRYKEQLLEKVAESVAAVLPITAIVLVLSITIAPLTPGILTLFLFGAVLLVVGMGLFTLGAEMAMIPMGEGIGAQLSKAKREYIPLVVCLLLGIIVTMAEPDLQVLAQQVPSIPSMPLIITVAVGVGIFLMIAQARMILKIPLSYLLLGFYAIVFILAYIAPNSFGAVAFDSGGVTTGPITVPFIMALGIGMASVRSDKNSTGDSFGLISLCSVGPILCVLILGICYKPEDVLYTPTVISELQTTKDAAREFLSGLPAYAREVAVALLPIVGLFVIFQLLFRRFHSTQLIRICSGFIYAYIGLVMFLTGVNVGFMPAGEYIGSTIASGSMKWFLIPIGMLIGYFIVKAEPAVQVLTKQVEDVTSGSVTRKSINLSLSIGIAFSVGLSMLRILTGLNIMWFLVPGYLAALTLTFFVPQIFTGIAFDSGGVASGPMTATFLLPLAMGACQAMGGNIMTDAFGIVALVAMTPLCTIQILGMVTSIREKKARERIREQLLDVEDTIVYFD